VWRHCRIMSNTLGWLFLSLPFQTFLSLEWKDRPLESSNLEGICVKVIWVYYPSFYDYILDPLSLYQSRIKILQSNLSLNGLSFPAKWSEDERPTATTKKNCSAIKQYRWASLFAISSAKFDREYWICR
jgi:hypothetical protein